METKEMKNRLILVTLILGMCLLYNCEISAPGDEVQPSAQQLPPPKPPDPDEDKIWCPADPRCDWPLPPPPIIF